jgi:hypothetical protein
MPTVIWLSVVLAALLGSLASPAAAFAVAGLGMLVCLFGLDAPWTSRLLTALAMVPAALIDSAPAWMWIVAGVAIGLATSLLGAEEPALSQEDELQRHLDWCRRREEGGHLLVAFLPEPQVPDPFRVVKCFRVTDSVSLRRSVGGFELHALLDDKRFVREGLEARLSEWCPERKYFGWATFPEDGVTIKALIDHAKSGILDRPAESRAEQESLSPVTQPFATKHV